MDFLEKLEKIKQQIEQYQKMSFENPEDDYGQNKSIKIKLQQLIIDSKKYEHTVTDSVLLTLAKSTGCAEDQEIAEEIVAYLHDNEYINDKQLDFFYNNIGTGRWM